MTTMDCAAARERAAELALGILDGEERAEVLAHVNRCAECQRAVDEHALVADLFPHLASPAEPPSGFEARTLSAMRGHRWRAARRRALVLAAAAAAAAIVSIATVRLIDASRDERPVAAPSLRSVAMTGDDGRHVGQVTIARGQPASLVVSVDYAVADGPYVLQLQRDDDPAADVGTITVSEGHGEWNGTAALPDDASVWLRMVDAAGAVVCQARLD